MLHSHHRLTLLTSCQPYLPYIHRKKKRRIAYSHKMLSRPKSNSLHILLCHSILVKFQQTLLINNIEYDIVRVMMNTCMCIGNFPSAANTIERRFSIEENFPIMAGEKK